MSKRIGILTAGGDSPGRYAAILAPDGTHLGTSQDKPHKAPVAGKVKTVPPVHPRVLSARGVGPISATERQLPAMRSARA